MNHLIAPPITRQQRRAQERNTAKNTSASASAHDLNTARYIVRNGVSHDRLTLPAHRRLMSILVKHGNRPNQAQSDALLGLLMSMTNMVMGILSGRWAFGLPTGLGKTSAIIAWCSVAAEAKLDVSVSVSAFQVEALCDLKRALIAHGVDAERIGLVHSYKHDPDAIKTGQPIPSGYASEPSTGELDRQIMLVTHNRVRKTEALELFSHHRGKERSLMLYDESLIVTDAVGLATPIINGAVGWLSGTYEYNAERADLVAYMTAAKKAINDVVRGGSADDEAAVIRLPHISEDDRQRFAQQLGRKDVADPLHTLLAIATEDVRVVPTGQGGGVVQYTVAVPQELRNIIVLDASHPIRSLVKLDQSISDAETKLTLRRSGTVEFSKLKMFDAVTIKQMFAHGGRTSMSRDFGGKRGARKVTREIAEVVKTIPADESVLVFVFKTTASDRTPYRKSLLEELEDRGIDVNAVDQHGRPRINVLTWGQQTSLNCYAHCEHVVLGGVLHRSHADLAAYYLGQTGDLRGRVGVDRIKELVDSEIAHVVYQALSRGCCRVIEDGRARKMTGYIIHVGTSLRTDLAPVMPGVVWQTWTPTQGGVSEAKITKLAAEIAAYLDTLSAGVNSVSTSKLKKTLNYIGPTMSFTHAVRRVSDHAAWMLEGRSVVRIFQHQN